MAAWKLAKSKRKIVLLPGKRAGWHLLCVRVCVSVYVFPLFCLNSACVVEKDGQLDDKTGGSEPCNKHSWPTSRKKEGCEFSLSIKRHFNTHACMKEPDTVHVWRNQTLSVFEGTGHCPRMKEPDTIRVWRNQTLSAYEGTRHCLCVKEPDIVHVWRNQTLSMPPNKQLHLSRC